MMFHNREQEQPRSHWWFPNRCYFLLLMLESFIGLITFVFTVLLTPYKSLGQSLELCTDGVAILTGLAGIVDALMTPRNRFSGFTTAFIVVDLAAFGLSFISLPVIVVRISTNNTDGIVTSVNYNWIVLLFISEVLAHLILLLLSTHLLSTLYRRVYSYLQTDTIDDVGNNDEIEMPDIQLSTL